MKPSKILVLISLLLAGCSSNYTFLGNNSSITNFKIIGEGVIALFHGGSNTREGLTRGGYILENPVWIIHPPVSNTIVFIDNVPNIQKYSGMTVHVEGKFVKVPEQIISPINFTYEYNSIVVDTIYEKE